jgi:hypothetical protein
MTRQPALEVTSLLSILLFSLHWADEIARGIAPGGLAGSGGLLILGTWLCGTLVLAERRSGLVITLLGALLASVVPLLHMQGSGMVGGRIAGTGGTFFWVWTLIALGATGIVSLVLAADGLWTLWRSPAPRDGRS